MGVTGLEGSKAISPLRRRMIEDMELASLMPDTQKSYLRAVVELVTFCGGKRPELISEEEVRRYLIWLRDERCVGMGTFQTRFSGLKMLLYRTLNCNWALFSKKRFAAQDRNACRVCFPGRSAVA